MKKRTKRIILFVILLVVAGWMIQAARENMRPAVGLVKISGPITDSGACLDVIRKFEKDERIKALLVRIDSPGGSVGPSQEIYAALKRVNETKPVVASMSGVGASGAYYIACAADRIYALPGTLTGSIGVIMKFVNFSEGLSKLGVEQESITSGELKDAGSSFRSMTTAERQYFESLTADVHQQFVEAVAASRGLPLDKMALMADGRVFTGRQALEVGLIDALGGFDDALADARKSAGLADDAPLVEVKPPADFVGYLRDAINGVTPAGIDTRNLESIRLEYRIR